MAPNRWAILAVLFAVRAMMAFQFQSVAAIAPLLSTKFGVGLTDIGALVGLYFSPWMATALVSGAAYLVLSNAAQSLLPPERN
jgi:hypothetical protein